MARFEELYREVMAYIEDIDVNQDGEHLWDNYQKIAAYLVRMTEIRNELVYDELTGHPDAATKKFRTLIVEKTIDDLARIAAFESRKLTAKSMEYELNK